VAFVFAASSHLDFRTLWIAYCLCKSCKALTHSINYWKCLYTYFKICC